MKKLIILFTLLLITSFTFALDTTNLVAWYKLDDTNATTIDSFAGINGNNVNIVQGQTGIIGTDYNFNGTTSDVTLTDTQFDFLTNHTNNAFTISLWAKQTTIGAFGSNPLFSKFGYYSGTSNNTGFVIDVRANGVIYIIEYKDNSNYRLYQSPNTNLLDGSFHHVVVTQSNGYTTTKLFVDGTERALTPTTQGTPASVNISDKARIGSDTRNNNFGSQVGAIDEVGIFNTNLSATDINLLRNNGSGVTYCPNILGFANDCASINVDFNYIIRKDLNLILLRDTSVANNVTKTAWTWKANGTTISTAQDYNLTATELTDYNICLHVDTNVSDVNGDKCYSFNSGDWSPPVTTFSSSQIESSTINTLTFTCTDNNSGCKWTTIKINDGDWNTWINTGTLDINYSGTGVNSIQYFSTDNSDNNETTKTSNFTTYGNARFTIKDQNSGLDLNGTQINFNGSDYVSGSNVYDFNLQELTATNTSYLFTISKTGYSTRYYQIDLNYFSSFDTNFALLPDSLDSDVPFKVYETDETTIFSNTYVEVKDSDTNWTVGRLKTSSTGEATFNLRTDDSNYISIVNNGEFTYSPVTVTVLYPKNEETLAQITEKWKIEITQNLYASYSDLNANKIIYLLPNTALPYNIKISDMNGNYFPRTYAKIYPGNPLTDTLQPYLINTTTGLLTTIRSVSAYTNQPVPNITVKIYKFISGQGRTYVEQILTDAKGEALTYAVLGAAYEYEIYSGATLIRIDAITATSSTVYIRIDDETYTPPIYQGGLFSVNFNPSKGTLSSFDKNLIQTISIFDLNSTITISNVILEIINTSINGTDGNDAIIYSLVIPYTDQNSITNNFDINSTSKIIEGVPYDTNGFIIIKVIIQTSDGNFVAFQTYKPFTGVNPLFDVGFGSRNFFGCDSYYDAQGNPNPLIPCPNQLFLALIISFILVAGFSFEMQFTNPTGLGLMFLLIMGFFTFITWIPIILYGLMVAGSIVIIIAARGRFT